MEAAVAQHRAAAALEEGRRGVAETAAAIEAIRNRTIAIVGVVGVVLGLTVGAVSGGWAWVVVALAVLLACPVLWILVPHTSSANVSPAKLLGEEWRFSPSDFTAHLATVHGRTVEDREKVIVKLNRCFIAVIVLVLALCVVLFLASGMNR